jgi:hypothetical protein
MAATATDEHFRELGRILYRALSMAGPYGLSRADLAAVAWVDEPDVRETIHWMREHGVAVTHKIVGPNDARYFLAEPLPDAWGETLP